jgi:site-specific recombinase XerD
MNIGNYLNQLSKAIQLRKYSHNTEESYVAQIDKFLKHFEPVATKPSEISAKQIESYLLKIQNSASHRAALCAIKFFYNEVGRQPRKLDHVPYPRKSEKLPIIYSPEEIQRLFNACDNTKHRVVLSIFYSTGLRISELLNLKWCDIDRSRMIINVVDGKGGKDRQVMLPESIIQLLTKYYIEYKPKEYILNGQFESKYSETSIRCVLKQLAKKAGIKKRIYPHLLRHCAFTHMVEAGTDLFMVQKIAGHKSQKTTQIYTHLSTTTISRVYSPISNIRM